MKKSLALAGFSVLILPLIGLGASGGDDESKRHTDEAGRFSFVPPADWTVRSVPGVKYRVVFGPAQSGFAPNINVVDEEYKGTLDDYVKANLSALRTKLGKFRVVEQGEFKTTSGLHGVRMVSDSEHSGYHLRQSFYFFDRGDTKYVATCSTLAEGGEKLDKIFERAMKSFRLED